MNTELAIDAGGVSLGRTGPLTILSIGGLDASAPIYVVDVQALGKDVGQCNQTRLLMRQMIL